MLPLMRIALRRYPRLLETIASRHINYNAATAYVKAREAAGAAFVIRPKQKQAVNHVEHNPDKLREAYALGRVAGEENIAAMKEFLT